jgi:circadian clock protein KaiB
MNKYQLKLYIAGKTSRSENAIRNLRQICEENLDKKYEIEIIDIIERPQLAEDERILATPTLIKSLPPPLRRLIGDLSETEKVLIGLDILPLPAANAD